jgi:tryptophan halogenase
MNSAIAAPSPREEDIPSHTLARALSSGWMWRIPTQDRFGNGYVYCDRFISDEDAEKEFRSQFSHDITIAKKIKFSAGYVDKFWKSNCLSVGLAGMFVEPLEATSIGSTIQQMFGFCSDISYWTTENQNISELYNNTFRKVAENIIDFVQLHYMTQRNDSEFWKWSKDNIELTKFHQQHLELFKTEAPGLSHFNHYFLMFKELNYMQVMHGLGMFDTARIKEKFMSHMPHIYRQSANNFKFAEEHINNSTYVSHRTALNEILKRSREQIYKL